MFETDLLSYQEAAIKGGSDVLLPRKSDDGGGIQLSDLSSIVSTFYPRHDIVRAELNISLEGRLHTRTGEDVSVRGRMSYQRGPGGHARGGPLATLGLVRGVPVPANEQATFLSAVSAYPSLVASNVAVPFRLTFAAPLDSEGDLVEWCLETNIAIDLTDVIIQALISDVRATRYGNLMVLHQSGSVCTVSLEISQIGDRIVGAVVEPSELIDPGILVEGERQFISVEAILLVRRNADR